MNKKYKTVIIQALMFFFAYAILFPFIKFLFMDNSLQLNNWLSKANLINAMFVTIIFEILLNVFSRKK